MNDAEAKTKNNRDVDASKPGAWQSSRRETQVVGYLKPAVDLSLRNFRDEAEIHAINYALEQTGWNRRQAAKLLGICYRGLLYKIRRHNITRTVEHS